jgi:AmmeMemoRadiSam system protein A
LPEEGLAKNVRRHAENAALHDYRFNPVPADEVSQLHIEISVLSVPQSIHSWRDIQIGRDGIILRYQGCSAVFLPQVAPEQGWDVEQTLMHLSMKAGLPPDAWKRDNAQFLTFQAQVFGEP